MCFTFTHFIKLTNIQIARLAQRDRSHFTSERSWLCTPAWSEMTLRIIPCKPEKSSGDDGTTLALKLMNKVT